MSSRRRPAPRRDHRGWRIRDYVGVAFVGFLTAGTLIDATHGRILIPVAVIGGAVLAWRVYRARVAAAWQEQERQRQAQLATDLNQLLACTPTHFEHIVGEVLGRYGYALTHAGRTCDRGVDLQGLAPTGQRCIVQVKLYSPHRSVSGPEVRAFIGAMVQARAQVGVFVTTARYTREAVAAAHQQPVWLIDGPCLVDLARNAAGPNPAVVPFGA